MSAKCYTEICTWVKMILSGWMCVYTAQSCQAYCAISSTLVRCGGNKSLLVGHVDCGISWVVRLDFADRFMAWLLLYCGQDCLMRHQPSVINIEKANRGYNMDMQKLNAVLVCFSFFSGTCPIITWRSCLRVVLPSWWIWSRCVWDTIPSFTSRRERSEALVPYVRCKCSYPVRKPLGSWTKTNPACEKHLIVSKLWHSGLEVYMPNHYATALSHRVTVLIWGKQVQGCSALITFLFFSTQ